MRNPLDSTGWVIRSGQGRPRFAGTCFAFRRTGYLLTAAHCVEGATERNTTVTIMLDEVEQGIEVDEIHRHPTADIAILRITDALRIFDTFRDVSRVPTLGSDVTAFGYPEDTRADGMMPTPRYFKGHVQRRFRHQSHLGHNYLAAELSFGAPAGLSGGPVALCSQPSHVIGLVTENQRSTTFLETVTDVVEGAERYREEVHSVIHYGVCSLLHPVSDWLNEHIPPTPNRRSSKRAV